MLQGGRPAQQIIGGLIGRGGRHALVESGSQRLEGFKAGVFRGDKEKCEGGEQRLPEQTVRLSQKENQSE